MRKKNYWKFLAIIAFFVILGLIGFYWFYLVKAPLNSYTELSLHPDRFKNLYPDKVNKKFGKCKVKIPEPILDSNYVKVIASLKGKSLSISEFEWNDSNYVSRPGCFKLNSDQSEHTMSNFIYHLKRDTLVSFYIKIRTTSNDNDYEFSLKIYNLKNELIGKYPDTGQSIKAKIDFIGFPAILSANVKVIN